ncbi:MAG: hypothetical protein WDN45_06500 [Caulobacteraceae bacterium]
MLKAQALGYLIVGPAHRHRRLVPQPWPRSHERRLRRRPDHGPGHRRQGGGPVVRHRSGDRRPGGAAARFRRGPQHDRGGPAWADRHPEGQGLSPGHRGGAGEHDAGPRPCRRRRAIRWP